jgi:FkbM family methyltransferase
MNPKQYAIQLVSRIARANNYQVIPDWDIANYPFVQHLKELFSLHKIDCVLDVGANTGQYRDLLRDKVGYQGEILSFEPVSHISIALSKRAKSDPHWKVFPFALGSAAGSAQINVTKAPSRNSLLAPRTDMVEGFWSVDAVTHLETVTIHTVDDFLSRHGIDCASRSVYLKLDTQGFDLEVVKGAASSLKHIHALQLEASMRPIYHGMPGYQEAIAFMNNSGYEVTGLFKIASDEKLRIVEFDCVMVNDRY